ncbi:hypothetical protein WN982_29130 [Paraburkholderia sp. IMGN_8]|uniref:hypothetical protein n=1 Tax=Paraburkholderia sp. IMGN_8 TaxID=3136564 RepID=UPI003100F588
MSRTHEAGKAGHRISFYEETRDSGVLVAVHVSPGNQSDAARVLRDAGGMAGCRTGFAAQRSPLRQTDSG